MPISVSLAQKVQSGSPSISVLLAQGQVSSPTLLLFALHHDCLRRSHCDMFQARSTASDQRTSARRTQRFWTEYVDLRCPLLSFVFYRHVRAGQGSQHAISADSQVHLLKSTVVHWRIRKERHQLAGRGVSLDTILHHFACFSKEYDENVSSLHCRAFICCRQKSWSHRIIKPDLRLNCKLNVNSLNSD